MLSKIVKNNNNYFILYIDGSMDVCTKREFNIFLKDFNNIKNYTGGSNRWDINFNKMEEYKGETIAQINDNYSITIYDIKPFEFLFNYSDKKNRDLTAIEYANKHNKSVEQIKVLCRNNKIVGARKIGRDWVIPEDSPYPISKKEQKKIL